MKEKKVLFIIPSLDIGGAQKVASFVANACVEAGYRVTVLAIEEGKKTVKLDPQISVYSICSNQNDLINQGTRNKVRVMFLLKKRIREIGADAIIVFGTMVQVYLALIGNNTPIMGAERGDPYSYPKRTQKLIRYSYKKYQVLTFQTTMARDAYGEIADGKSFVIPNPCFLINNKSFGGKSNKREKKIVSVGRLVEEKGYSFLIDAMVHFHKDHPDYELVIYGEGPIRTDLEKQIDQNNASAYISLPGSIVGIENYIKDASLFVLSSKYEGVPNTLLEAMALGVPVVACDCSPGGARFLTQNGTIGGPIIPYGNSNELYFQIKRMIEDKEYAEQMAEKGLMVRKDYAPERISSMWLDAINKLLSFCN